MATIIKYRFNILKTKHLLVMLEPIKFKQKN